MNIKAKKLHPDAVIPQHAHYGDAGTDLFSIEEVSVKSGESAVIATGIAMAIPVGYVGLIWDKSGLAIKSQLKVLGGVIDSGYRGEIKVGIINLGKETYVFKKGDKVAQMLMQKVEGVEFAEVSELDSTERAEGGFGSTGR